MNRRDFYVKQKVTEGELDDAFLQVEVAEQNLKKDAFGPAARGFLMANITVVEDAPQSQAVSVPVFLGWGKDGERIEKTSTPQLFDFAGDEDPADPTIASLYAVFDRILSDPRVDGLGATVDFKVDETFDIERDLGTPAGSPVPPAIRTDGSIFLCNVTIPAAAAVITDSEIDNTVQELESDFPIGRLRNMSAGMEDAMEAAVSESPTTANRVALLADAGVTQMRGYISNVKIVALTASTVDVESAVAVNADGVLPPAGTPNTLMSVKNAAIDLAGPLGPGSLDVGAVADGVYFVYLIGDSTGVAAADVVASLDAGPGYAGVGPSFANLPNHDVFRLIGMINRQAGAILPYRQIGEEVIYDDAPLQTAFAFGLDPHGGAGPTAFIALSLSPYATPIAERVTISLHQLTSGANTPEFRFRSLGGPAVAGYSNHIIAGAGGSASRDTAANMQLHVSATQTIDWNRQVGVAAHSVEIFVIGVHLDLKYE